MNSLTEFECCAYNAKNYTFHYVAHPVKLSCGHFVCHDCIHYAQVTCTRCNLKTTFNEANMNVDLEFQEKLFSNLEPLCKNIVMKIFDEICEDVQTGMLYKNA